MQVCNHSVQRLVRLVNEVVRHVVRMVHVLLKLLLLDSTSAGASLKTRTLSHLHRQSIVC
jgi:hypothetical protein